MSAKLPNLELILYKAKEALCASETFKKAYEELKENNNFVILDYDLEVFPQVWGSTTTAFDVTDDGEPTMGGSAMTKAYTVVVHELRTNMFVIFVDNKPCYLVENATETFLEDLKNRWLRSLSEARKLY